MGQASSRCSPAYCYEDGPDMEILTIVKYKIVRDVELRNTRALEDVVEGRKLEEGFEFISHEIVKTKVQTWIRYDEEMILDAQGEGDVGGGGDESDEEETTQH
ncbi:hypothetical protein AAMO2058_001130300 [Amorphochlora amoebiformis]